MTTITEPKSEAGTSAKQAARQGVVDCDIHPQFARRDEILPFLPRRWRDYIAQFGGHYRQPLADTLSHPRINPEVSRRDAWPPTGGPPGSDLQFMREQLLDAYNLAWGILMPLNRGPGNQRNLEYGAALARAVNDWQIAYWVEREPRLKASIVVTQEDTDAAIAEIEARAGDQRFVQVMMPPRSLEPLGRRRYWPIYEAAIAAGRPVALHVGGINGYPSTGGGWPSYYIEEQHSNVQGMQGLVTSLVIEGVFERYPALRVVLVEGGIAWARSLMWRLDKHWRRLKSEAPHLRRLPSEYIRSNIYYTTQPLDEPDCDADLLEAYEAVGLDRVMYSSDYPHWDMDEPAFVLSKLRISDADRTRIMGGNAKELYGLP